MSLELKVLERTAGAIIINYDDLKQKLELELKKYKGVVFNEEQIGEAKKTRAELNNVAKAISDRRIAEKKEFLKGFEDFESQTKELTKMVEDVSKEIDKQVKEFEEKKVEEKRLLIKELWKKEEFNLIELEKIYNPKWENATYKLETIEEDIKNAIKVIKDDLDNFDFLLKDKPEVASNLKAKYLISLDKGKVIYDYQQEELLKQKLEEQKKAEEVAIVEEDKSIKVSIFDTETKNEEVQYELTFRVIGSEKQIKALSNYLKENKINYIRVGGKE